MKKQYFKLYSNCLLVNGAKRHIICDIQRNEIFIVPIVLSKILDDDFKVEMDELDEIEDKQIKTKIFDLLDFLIENELGFICNNPESFPSIKKQWESPSLISNCIICIDKFSQFGISDICKQLTALGCKYLEIRISTYGIFLDKIDDIVENLDASTFRNIDLYIGYDVQVNRFDFKSFLLLNQRIGRIFIYSTPPEIIKKSDCESVFFIESDLSNLHCGNIYESYFSVNVNSYMESLFHNSCLNRKMSIDINGNIKNCPSMSQSFGNIKDTTLAEALEKPDFKKYWNINKDKIHVCKDCEFRYICTDCRAYVEDPEDILSKPLKCGYNPYTGEWSEWSTNPLKQKAIEHYGMQDLIAETKPTP